MSILDRDNKKRIIATTHIVTQLDKIFTPRVNWHGRWEKGFYTFYFNLITGLTTVVVEGICIPDNHVLIDSWVPLEAHLEQGKKEWKLVICDLQRNYTTRFIPIPDELWEEVLVNETLNKLNQ